MGKAVGKSGAVICVDHRIKPAQFAPQTSNEVPNVDSKRRHELKASPVAIETPNATAACGVYFNSPGANVTR